MRKGEWFQALTYWPTILLLKFFARYEIRGQENLAGINNRGLIFASNHCAYIDGPISAVSLPLRNKEWYPKSFFSIRFLVTERFFHWYYLAICWYVRANGCIKIEKGKKGDHASRLVHAVEALKDGDNIWIYPEGGWDDKNAGSIQRFRLGVSYLHRETGAVIVPVGIIGNHRILSFRTLLRKNKVVIRFGKPILTLDNPRRCDLIEGAKKVEMHVRQIVKEMA